MEPSAGWPSSQHRQAPLSRPSTCPPPWPRPRQEAHLSGARCRGCGGSETVPSPCSHPDTRTAGPVARCSMTTQRQSRCRRRRRSCGPPTLRMRHAYALRRRWHSMAGGTRRGTTRKDAAGGGRGTQRSEPHRTREHPAAPCSRHSGRRSTLRVCGYVGMWVCGQSVKQLDGSGLGTPGTKADLPLLHCSSICGVSAADILTQPRHHHPPPARARPRTRPRTLIGTLIALLTVCQHFVSFSDRLRHGTAPQPPARQSGSEHLNAGITDVFS